MSKSDAITHLESLTQDPLVEYGFTGDATPDFQVHDNPAVLRAYGMTGSQTAQVWQSDLDGGESEFLLHGKTFILSSTITAIVIPLPGLYFLKLTGMDGNVRIVKQLTELGRHLKMVTVNQDSGDGHAQNTDTQLIRSNGDALTADEIFAGLGDEAGFTAIAGEAIKSGQPVYARRLNGMLMLAHTGTDEASTCVGIAAENVEAGFQCRVHDASHTQPSWLDSTDAAPLSVGNDYWLSETPGVLTLTPNQASGQFMAAVGRAETASRLLLTLQPSILL